MTLQTRLDDAIDRALGNRIVGCRVVVSRSGVLVHDRAAGMADREAGRPVTPDTIFRLASVTKVVLAACALRLVDLGRIGLDDPVTRYLPDFQPRLADGRVPRVLLRHLLTHGSGLTHPRPAALLHRQSDGSFLATDEILARIAEVPLLFPPGTGWDYGLSFEVLGALLARVSDSDLAGAIARHVSAPLGLTDTGFLVSDPSRLARAYKDGSPPVAMTEPDSLTDATGHVWDFSPERVVQARAPQGGGGGMAGTADDVMRLLTALLGDFLSPGLRDMAFSNQIGPLRAFADEGQGFLGGVIDDLAPRSHLPRGAVEWGGTHGCSWVIHPATQTVLVSLTNTAIEGCFGAFVEDVQKAVFA